jgi:hypothetical protein
MGNLMSGDKIDMNLLEMAFYGLVPMFGQLCMRIFKLNGSLDKPYLLFPLFFIPPFSFIPVIMAKLGMIKKLKDAGSPIDIYILIPIIFRFILILFMAQITNGMELFKQVGLIMIALFATNMIRSYTTRNCDKVGGHNIFGNIMKSSIDSMAEYSIGVLSTFLILFVPFIKPIFETINLLKIPYMHQIIDSTIWGLGVGSGYLLVNMFDSNYDSAVDYCQGKTGTIRTIISVVAFAFSLFYQVRPLIMQ